MAIALRKFIAPEFIYGTDAALLAGQYAENIGIHRILIVTDAIVSTYDWYTEIIDHLET